MRNFIITTLIILSLFAGITNAQYQQNNHGLQAALIPLDPIINPTSAPPFEIHHPTCTTGVHQLFLYGDSGSMFAVFYSYGPAVPNGLVTSGGIVNLDLTTPGFLIFYTLGFEPSAGLVSIFLNVPATLCGIGFGTVQAFVSNPSAPNGFWLTAAVQVDFF